MELTRDTVWGYLTARGVPLVRVRELSGGVSGRVFWVDAQSGAFVLKQALPTLRVAQVWEADPERAWTEAAALRTVEALLPPASVPHVLWEDPERYAFAMSAVPARTWRDDLLVGRFDEEVARRAALLLVLLVEATSGRPEIQARFGDRRLFEQLRIEPYYRAVSTLHPDVAAAAVSTLAESEAQARCLVHGDFSPKNLLVSEQGLTLIDWEVAHYGDPSFDVAFCLSLLLLGGFFQPAQWAARERMIRVFVGVLRERLSAALEGFERRAVRHLGLLILARVDGKSPVDYLREERTRAQVRAAAKGLIFEPSAALEEVVERWAAAMALAQAPSDRSGDIGG
jgi:aminoglycoside phosphotransferase (APT) family kinase protein